MYLEMKVFGFALDGIAQMPVIILKDAEEKNTVPVWVSATESVSFAAEFLSRELSVRSGRKDVFSALIDKLGMKLSGIVIESLKDGVFNSLVRLSAADGEEVDVELHVSEAMLLSLKYRLPVLVNDALLEQVSSLDMSEEGFTGENNARRFVDYLDQLDPAAMGKYPM
ncbi:MAG TPA: bifunctional nuclease family protein [Geomonas sp.]|nr:bifunctional nuclease family protein [Geomonas sp.]